MGVLLLLSAAAVLYLSHADSVRIGELESQIGELREQEKQSDIDCRVSKQMEEIAYGQQQLSEERSVEAIRQSEIAQEMTLQSRTYYFLYDLYRGFPSMHDRASAYWSEAVASAGSIVSSKPMPARCILDIGAAYTLGPVTLSIDIHNLLGTRHHRSGMNTSVIPQQGRWIIAAIAVGL